MTVLKEKLLEGINDRSRKVRIFGKQAIIPLKFDKEGNPTSVDKLVFKRLTLNDLRFLKEWRNSNWDTDRASEKCGLDKAAPRTARLIKRLACFRDEDAKVKALCEIPTPSWIASKHVENVYSGGSLDDSSHKSLQELAKIEGAYKQQAVNTQINVFNLPKLTPDVEAKFKELAEQALESEVVNA